MTVCVCVCARCIATMAKGETGGQNKDRTWVYQCAAKNVLVRGDMVFNSVFVYVVELYIASVL